MPRTRANGEGSISKRRDGRYEAAAWVATVSGKRKRVRTYAKTREEAHERLVAQLTLAKQGIPAPDRPWRLGAYLDYWLRDVVSAKTRPRTLEQYEAVVRRYLKPYLGTKSLTKLSVVDVQGFLNDQIRQGRSVRSIHLIRSVLRAALSRAQREELVVRNVAKLVEIPAWERKPIQPWSAEDATAFLAATEDHRLYPAFVMLLLYGMRRGEVLGLRWCDVDFARGQLHVHQQLQRIGMNLEQGPVKTRAGRRDLPLIAVLHEALTRRYAMRRGIEINAVAQQAATDTDLVFLSTTDTPIDPKNFVRTFQLLREKAGLLRITVHHTRHTAATILKNLGVPARDAQLILGHAHITTTQQLYQHGDIEGQTKALNKVEQLLLSVANSGGSRQHQPAIGTFPQVKARDFAHSPLEGPVGLEPTTPCLKATLLLGNSTLTTPVIRHVRARAHRYILGHAAVKYGRQSDPPEDAAAGDVDGWIEVLQILDYIEMRRMRQRSFPLNLLPGTQSSILPFQSDMNIIESTYDERRVT